MIYLASPYSHPDKAVEARRFGVVCRKAAEMMRDGYVVFSPIAHTHSIALAGNLPTGWDYWKRVDRELVMLCSRMVVLMLDGWEQSVGVQAEIEYAKELRIPIEYKSPN